jgi:hypothetical protein
MSEMIPEKNKRAGVCYAWSDDSIELPVIDITHPAFDFSISDEALSALIDAMARSAQIPAAALQAAAQKSILVRGMVESAGTFTTGMMTYLNKLPPEMLGEGYAGLLDRQWAGSLTPVTFRWRMRDVAHLLADALVSALTERPGSPVHLVNIGGGPAMDSLNALILVQKAHREKLAGRAVTIHVLDIDAQGPDFGYHALEALRATGGPLEGVRAQLDYIPYNWSQPDTLRALLKGFKLGAVVMGSSEGGLFEYASDNEICANLRTLYDGTPDDFRMVGPVVRNDQTLDPRLRGTEHVEGRPAVRYIGLEHFGELAKSAGWGIESRADGPMHQVVRLKKVV